MAQLDEHPTLMEHSEWIGWLSSAILLATIARQIHKQWKTQSAEDVSKYLFVGQVAAETGFVIYSLLLKNWVFFAVNLLLVIENFIGLAVTLKIKSTKA